MLRQRDFRLPDGIERRDFGGEAFLQGAAAFAFAAAVGKSGVVPGDAIRHQFAHQFPAGDGFFGASGGVIDALRRTGKAQLEGVAVFAEVVQEAGVAGDVGGAEGFGELGGKRGDVFGVAFQGLPVALRAVFGGVAVVGGHGALRLGLARYGSAA